ncbi:TetR/AcrR family transcriptional regulator [Larkinella harenae]
MRDIAELAGINTALTDYYFRSKENLFWIVFDDLLKQSLDQLNELFNSQLPLREKIPLMIQQHYEFHSKNPQLSLFIMNEIRRNPERFAQKSGLRDVFSHSVFSQQLEEGIRQNQIRAISAAHLLGLMFAHCQQLYAGKSLHMVLFKTDEADFEDYARVQVGIVIDMILCYLFIND